MSSLTIRLANDTDGPALGGLIASCWSEYPGIIVDLEAELPELPALATYYATQGGPLWAAEADHRIVGMIATRPLDATTWEICKVYIDAAHRGRGLAHRLLDTAESHAATAGATTLKLWSDTRFDRAHRFYEKRGYIRSGPIRVLNDLSSSLEFAYAKPFNGVDVLDAAAAASAERCLADALVAVVADGAAVSFLPPLAPETARAFWHRKASDVAAGTRIIVAGWADGTLAGCVMLDLDTPPNQPHRADVQKLLVNPAARRRGLARALMRRLEQEAARAGRTLLTLDTRAGDTAEMLYRAEGWTEAGRIPGYALNADGTPHDTVYFFKRLSPRTV